MRKDIQAINEAYESIKEDPSAFMYDDDDNIEQSYKFMAIYGGGDAVTADKWTVRPFDSDLWENADDDLDSEYMRTGDSGWYILVVGNTKQELKERIAEYKQTLRGDEDEEKNVKRHSLQRNTDAMRAQFTKDKSAANVRRPETWTARVQGIKRDTLKTQGGI